MLKSIFIQDFALIKKVNFSFKSGYTAITGETGAGKSIMFEALQYLTGKRTDSSIIRKGQPKAVIEGEFICKNDSIDDFLASNEVDRFPSIIIRRELRITGRSRGFLNDTPVSNSVLKDLCLMLFDIHEQHELLGILSASNQLKYLDNFAELNGLISVYSIAFNDLKTLQIQFEKLTEQERKANLEKDYFEFLVDELDKANLVDKEDIELTKRFEFLENVKDIKSAFNEIVETIENKGGVGVLNSVHQLVSKNTKAANQYEPLNVLFGRLKELEIELTDIFQEAESEMEEIEFNPNEKENIEDRLDLINSLMSKHQVETTEELKAVEISLVDQLNSLSSMSKQIEALEIEIKSGKTDLMQKAVNLSKLRKNAAQNFDKQIVEVIKDLGMPYAQFKTVFDELREPNPKGLDSINFMFSANKGGDIQELSKAASGGELSRVMLSIKSILASKKAVETLVFDEIDSGVSGEIAHRFGKIFSRIGEKCQVLAITHLPQVAAKGHHHAHVSKLITDDTETAIKYLDDTERVEETAKLISAEKLTNAALENAKQLLKA